MGKAPDEDKCEARTEKWSKLLAELTRIATPTVSLPRPAVQSERTPT